MFKSEKKDKRKKWDVLGLVGICTGWIVPILGMVFGIISLVRKEKTKEIGFVSIIESVIFWIIWTLIIWKSKI